MNLLKETHTDPRLAKLDKQSQELALAFAEMLSKGRIGDAPGIEPEFSPLLKSMAELSKADPDPDDLHVSTELTDRSIGYFQQMGQFAAASIGVLAVTQKNDKIRRWNKGDLYRDEAEPRAPATEAAGGAIGKDTIDYICERYAWKQDIDDETIANDRVEDPADRALRVVTQKLLIRRDAHWVTKIFLTSTWTRDRDGVTSGPTGAQFLRWDESGSTPRADLSGDAVRIHELTGFWPNVLTLQPHVLKALILHADVLAAFQYTVAGAVPSMGALAASLFGGAVGADPTIRIAGGVKTTSAKGASADTFSYIAGKHALLAYVDVNFGLLMPTAYTVPSWENEVFGTGENGVRIREYEVIERAVPSRVEGEIFFDAVVTAADLGAFYEAAVS